MEFIVEAETVVRKLVKAVTKCITIKPVATMVVDYVTTVDLEFETRLMYAAWDKEGNLFGRVEEARSHPVAARYMEAVIESHPDEMWDSAFETVLTIAEEGDAGKSCHRVRCYYPYNANPGPCICGSPMIPPPPFMRDEE